MPIRSSLAPQNTDTTLLYLVKQLELAIRSRLEELLRPAGLTALQYSALTVLERQANLTSAQLARNSFVTAQTMADMITALQQRGLVERRRDPDDRRRLVLGLTADGRRLLGRFRGKVGAVEASMVAGLTRGQSADLRASLLACHTALAARPPR